MDAQIEFMRWKNVIKRALARGSFTESERLRARLWNTCAVGEKFDATPTDPKGLLPPKGALFDLGCRFSDAVCNNQITKAAEFLAQIEAFEDA